MQLSLWNIEYSVATPLYLNSNELLCWHKQDSKNKVTNSFCHGELLMKVSSFCLL